LSPSFQNNGNFFTVFFLIPAGSVYPLGVTLSYGRFIPRNEAHQRTPKRPFGAPRSGAFIEGVTE